MAWNESPLVKNLPAIIGIVLLIFILLFVLVNFGYLRCCDIPGFCSVYYGIKGYPRIVIVSADWDSLDPGAGMGDPKKLMNAIIDRTHQFPDQMNLDDLITSGVLDKYQLVIVERAKKIDTPQFYIFRDYVMKGGKIVWIGDAGTELGDKDYTCEKVTISFHPAYNQSTGITCDMIYEPDLKQKCKEGKCDELTGTNQQICNATKGGAFGTPGTSAVACSETWQEDTPNIPSNIEGGVCGKTFGEIVVNYEKEKKKILDWMDNVGAFACPADEKDWYQLKGEGAEKITKCVDLILSKDSTLKEADITADMVESNCSLGYANYWKRGPSETETGTKLDAINFGSVVLGVDYVGSTFTEANGTNLFLQPVEVTHALVRGYGAKTQFYGAAQFAMADPSRYSARSVSLMNLKYFGDSYPAVIVSSPLGPAALTKVGLIIYYAFPPELNARQDPDTGEFTGPGINLINNLIDFAICK
jgi:hypothetical protein